jgi:hypothetical protein
VATRQQLHGPKPAGDQARPRRQWRDAHGQIEVLLDEIDHAIREREVELQLRVSARNVEQHRGGTIPASSLAAP